jgi:gluconolactonase
MTVAAKSPRLHDLIAADAKLEEIASGCVFTEGPVWVASQGALYFSDMPDDCRRKWTAGEGTTEVARPSNKGNGMSLDLDGNLLVCEHSTSCVVRIGWDGTREILASHYEGKELNSPNDLVVRADGSIYFTDPWYGRMPVFGVERERELDICGVYRISPSGELSLVADDFAMPNGLCFTADEKTLYINDTDRMHIRRFAVSGDGSISGGEVFFTEEGTGKIADGIPDGMKLDEQGNIYVSGPGGIWIISPEAEMLGKIETSENVGNHCWGGDDWHTLFITTSSTVQRITTKVGPLRTPTMK